MGRTLPSLLEIADPDDIREKLDAVRATAKDELALKRGVVSVLKQALTEGREKARERLEQGAHRGRACAEVGEQGADLMTGPAGRPLTVRRLTETPSQHN